MGNRMTAHSGRITHAKARHLDRENLTAEHIDSTRTRQNRYWNLYDGEYSGRTEKEHFSMTEAEQKCYQELYQGHIDNVNERAEQTRHRENRTSVSRLLTSKKTMPQDNVFQVGSVRDDVINPTDLWHIWREFMRWHKTKYPQAVIMDCAMHLDESVPHVHDRRTFWYSDKDGIVRIGQEKALEQMGVPLPEPDKPRGRYNNRKQTYTRECRERLMEICAEYGYNIIEKPLEKRRHNLPKIEAIVEELRRDRDTLLKANEQLILENKRLQERMEYADAFNEFVEEIEAEVEAEKGKGKGRGR